MRWRQLESSRRSRRRLESFHSRHRLQLRSHSPPLGRRLEKLVARDRPMAELYGSYIALAMSAMQKRRTLQVDWRVCTARVSPTL